jgi:hypothetical protein
LGEGKRDRLTRFNGPKINCEDTRNWEGNENISEISSRSAITPIRNNSNVKLLQGADIVKELEEICNELPSQESLEPPRQISPLKSRYILPETEQKEPQRENSPQRTRLITPNRARRLKIEEVKEEEDPNQERVHKEIVNDLELL